VKRNLGIAVILAIIVALLGTAIAQAGMMGPGTGRGQAGEPSPQPQADKPSEQPGEMPMTPEHSARMMNACIGAMEGMAQMGRMMGGMGGTEQQRGTPQKPSGQQQ